MVSQIKSIDSLDITPLNLTNLDRQPVQETSISSSRASIRRMRRETIVQPNILSVTETFPSDRSMFDHLAERFTLIYDQIDLAMRDGRYSDALLHLKELEELIDANKEKLINLPDLTIDQTLIRSLIEHLEIWLLSTSRAYFLALNGDASAISLCDTGFDNLELFVEELATFLMARDSDVAETKQMLEISHSFMRGMLEMSLNSRESAIADLKTAFALALESDVELGTGSLFLIKVLEQKFQAPLLPSPIFVDEENPDALILAGRYEEALTLLSTNYRFKDQAAYDGKRAVCLALLGKHDEALETFRNGFYDMQDTLDDRSLGMCLVQILKNDYEQAREIVKAPTTDPALASILLLVIHGSENLKSSK